MKIVLGNSRRLEENPQCPVCRAMLDGCTPVNCNNKPKPGDFTICAYCNTILRFEFALELRKATEDDLNMLRSRQPDTFEALQKVAGAAQKVTRDRRREKYSNN